jgi:hypothetical protein
MQNASVSIAQCSAHTETQSLHAMEGQPPLDREIGGASFQVRVPRIDASHPQRIASLEREGQRLLRSHGITQSNHCRGAVCMFECMHADFRLPSVRVRVMPNWMGWWLGW